ncbi:MAG: serine/threonine-protein kinase [Kofleriaceae bacterium]
MDFDRDPLLGAVVGPYVIEALAGEGGMGRVYRAHHARLEQRRVALKVLLGDLAATLATRIRFTQEAEAASRLEHPNVVGVTDFGRSEEGLTYLVMDFVDGRPLSSIIADGPIAWPRAIRLARAMASGLEHAHRIGLVHRDFKPENVLVVNRDGDEVPRIVDFGIAILADPTSEQPRLTSVGVAMGTPIYAAPEQTHNRTIDHRADLFSFGVTLFEMLAGTTPYDGTIVELVQRNAMGQIPTIDQRAPGVVVPEALEQLIQTLMAPSPKDRPPSARTVIDALDEIARGKTPASPPAKAPVAPAATVPMPASDEASPTKRKNRWRWAFASIVVIAALAVAFGVVTASRTTRPTPPSAVVADTLRAVEQSADGASSMTPQPAPAQPAPAQPAPAPREEASVAKLDSTESVTEPATPPPTNIPAPPRKRAVKTSSVDRPVPPAPEVTSEARKIVAETTSSPDSGSALVEKEPSAQALVDVVRPAPPDSSLPPASPRPTVVTEPPRVIATSAKVGLDRLVVTGSLTNETVLRGLSRAVPGIRACYGPAVRQAGRAPALALAARMYIDEHRVVRGVQVAPSALPGLTDCVVAALSAVRSEVAPDVGTVEVKLVIRFTPEAM